MRIVVHGQQAFGKAVLERLLERNEDVVGVFCAPDREGRPTDPLRSSRSSAACRCTSQPHGRPTRRRADAPVRPRSLRHGLRHPASATAGARCAEARHDPVPPLAAAQASRAELDQLADHPGRDRDRDHHLLARRGIGRGSDPPERSRSAGRYARQPVLQPPLPDRRRRHDGGDRSGARGQGAADRAGPRAGDLRELVQEGGCQIDWSKPASARSTT